MSNISEQITRQIKKYELNQTEEKVLDHILKHSEKTVRELESDFRMSRTRVTYTLSKLCERGLVHKTLAGRKYVYKPRKDIISKPTETLTIEDLLHKMRNAKHTKLYGIQSDGAVMHLISSMNTDSRVIEKIHRVQKQRSVIIEALISKKSLKKIQKINLRLKKSHIGRPSIFYVNEADLKGDTDIYFDQSAVYIADYRKKQANILHNTDLSLLLVQLFNIIKLSSEKVSTIDVYKVLE